MTNYRRRKRSSGIFLKAQKACGVCNPSMLPCFPYQAIMTFIFYVDGADFQYTGPLRFCANPTASYSKIVPNLTLTFREDNTDRSTANMANIVNKLPVDLPGCRIRFVMKKGTYRVSNRSVSQVVDTDTCTIIDVRADAKANGQQTITLKSVR